MCVWGVAISTGYPVQGLGNSTVVLRVGDSYHVTSGVGDPVTWHSNTASVPTAADTAVNSDTNFGAAVTGTQKTQNHAFNSSCNLFPNPNPERVAYVAAAGFLPHYQNGP